MKRVKFFGIKIISILLSVCILLLTSCSMAGNTNEQISKEEETFKTLEQMLNVRIVSDTDENVLCISNNGHYEITHNNDSGELYYTDDDGTFDLLITDVSQDGLLYWRVEKEDEILEGELNTSEAPTPQFALTIAGTTYAVSAAVYCLLKATIVVTIAGATCYVAEVVADKIKSNSKSANYFPAYSVFGNVYVATDIGISRDKAVSRIEKGKHVWAKNAQYAATACVKASPIGVAEWGWHGNRKTSSGYYPHYHAVNYYKKNGQYVHTGAHCWYI